LRPGLTHFLCLFLFVLALVDFRGSSEENIFFLFLQKQLVCKELSLVFSEKILPKQY